MELIDLIMKLPDEKYKQCTVTDTAIYLPIDIDINEFKVTMQSKIVTDTLTTEKAVYAALLGLKLKKTEVVSPAVKLINYYKVKK